MNRNYLIIGIVALVVILAIILSFLFSDGKNGCPKPEVKISIMKDTIALSDFAEFKSESKDKIENYSWTFQDEESQTSIEQEPKIKFISPGKKAIQLTVKNYCGNSSDKAIGSIFVTDPRPDCEGKKPKANFTLKKNSITAGQSITITNNSEPKSDDVKWEWTFEGGKPDKSDKKDPPDIKYSKAGKYAIKLKCQNKCDSSEKIDSIYVMNPPPPPPPPPPPTPINENSILLDAKDDYMLLRFPKKLKITKVKSVTFITIDPPLTDNKVRVDIPFTSIEKDNKTQIAEFDTYKINNINLTKDTEKRNQVIISVKCINDKNKYFDYRKTINNDFFFPTETCTSPPKNTN